jgi:iron complex outermembrane recepter protein
LAIIKFRRRAAELPHPKKKDNEQEIKPVLMKHCLTFFIYLLIILQASAQSGRGAIQITVSNELNTPAEHATVELLKTDSSLVKIALTNSAGIAEFEAISFGDYLLRASIVHHKTYYSEQFTLSADNQTKTIRATVSKLAAEMQGVTVSAKKPFVQRLTDRIVVNVENSIIGSGSSAMDVLERSPGVRIGQNDLISLAGKPGVIIMINGKNVPMSGEELGNYLRSLPASVIERIDIITNPSARYDAAGNAGIIDIRMKKDQKLGANGTITAGYGQGRYPKANTGGTFNYRSKKLNIFGNLNYSYAKHFNNLVTQRFFYSNGVYTGSYDQDNLIYRVFNSGVARLGADYFLNKKTVVGVLLTGSRFMTKRYGDNASQVLDQDNNKQASFNTRADGDENYKNYVVNFNLKHTFDSTGKELTADFDVAGYYRDWQSFFSTGYYDANEVPTQPLFLARTSQQGFTGINTLKVDYVHPLTKSAKFETGFKTSFVRSNNDVRFFDRSNGAEKLDSSQSNSFRYKENINAAYLNFSKQWKKFSLQLGLRAEETNVETYQVFDKSAFDTSYLRLFPSAFFNYRPTENNTIGISVSRRIDRPGYNQLNPFRIFVDPSFYAAGDPLLKPSFTWSYELSYTRKQLNVTLAYSRTTNPWTIVLIPSESNPRVTIQTPINYDRFDYYGMNFNLPLRITKWWNVINNGNVYVARNKGYIAKTVVNSTTLNAQFSTNHTLTIGNGWSSEVNFTFDSGNNTGFMRDRFYWILGAGIQKTLLAKKGTLRFNVTDILWRQWPQFRSIYTNYREFLYAKRDTRVANITFTYRIGKNTVTQARRRTTASEEERRRAGN